MSADAREVLRVRLRVRADAHWRRATRAGQGSGYPVAVMDQQARRGKRP
jgi:hypothetical protein